MVLVVDNPPLGDSKTCGVRTVDIPFVGLTKLNSEPEDCSMTLEEYYRLRSRYIQSLESIAAKFGDQVRIFDTAEIFCDTERGLCLRFKNGKSSFGYTDHMSDYMSGLVGVELNRFLAEWLSEGN